MELDTLFRDVASVLSEKCINPESSRPYTISMLERALKDSHFSVDPKRPAKAQAMEVRRLGRGKRRGRGPKGVKSQKSAAIGEWPKVKRFLGRTAGVADAWWLGVGSWVLGVGAGGCTGTACTSRGLSRVVGALLIPNTHPSQPHPRTLAPLLVA